MRAAAVALGFIAALSSATALADTSTGPLADRTTKDGAARNSATVVVFNRPIIHFRAPVLGVPVEQRAQNAAERIRALLAAPGEHKVTTEQVTQGVLVKIDGATNLSGTPRFMLQSLGRPGTGYSAQIKRDGTFEFYDFLPGKYRVQVEPLPDTFFLESAKLGARDVLQEGIEVEGTISESLQIVLSDKAAALNGAVWDDDQKPIPGALVVLIPRTRTREELYVASTTADNGSFQMLRLTPGDYDAYAWRYSDAIESYRDPDFLAKYLARRTPLHLEPGAVSNISLQVLPEK